MSRTGSADRAGAAGRAGAWTARAVALGLAALGTASAAAAPPPPPVPRVVVGGHLGVALPLAGLGPAVAPAVEGGVTVDPAGRFTVLLRASYAESHAQGTAPGPDADTPADWTLAVRALELAPTLRVRLLPWSEALSPEVSAGPLVLLADTVSTGAWRGEPLPAAREARDASGGFVAAGLAGRVGPGVLDGRITVSVLRLDGALTGVALVPTVTPALGYRVER